MFGEYANIVKAGGIILGSLLFLGGQLMKVSQMDEALVLLQDLNTRVVIIDTMVNEMKEKSGSFASTENTESLRRDISRLDSTVNKLSERVDKLAEKMED